MNLRRLQLGLVLILLLSLFVTTYTVSAQTTSAVCTNVVNQTITQMGVNCANRTTGTACYAAPELESVLNPSLDPQVFDEPGERVGLIDAIHLRPQAVSTIDQTWGIAAMNLQASLPTSFAQDVVVIGFGGAEIENGVMPEEAFVPSSAPISVSTTLAAELRAPTMNPGAAEITGQVPNGIGVTADVVSADGQWVRVIVGDEPGWLPAAAFNSAEIASLPILDGLTPMQSFYLRTGVDGRQCANAPSLVVVQGPQDIPVDLVVYGVDMRLQSTMILRTIDAGEPVGLQLEVIVLYGLVTINPDSGAPIYIPPGHLLRINLGPELVSLGIEGDADERGVLSFGIPRPLTRTELDELQIVLFIPDNIVNYPIEIPEILTPSGVTDIIVRIIYRNPRAIAAVRALCEDGRLPPAVCDLFDF